MHTKKKKHKHTHTLKPSAQCRQAHTSWEQSVHSFRIPSELRFQSVCFRCQNKTKQKTHIWGESWRKRCIQDTPSLRSLSSRYRTVFPPSSLVLLSGYTWMAPCSIPSDCSWNPPTSKRQLLGSFFFSFSSTFHHFGAQWEKDKQSHNVISCELKFISCVFLMKSTEIYQLDQIIFAIF